MAVRVRVWMRLGLMLTLLAVFAPGPGASATQSTLQFSPAAVDFGDQQIGVTSAPRDITVTNVTDTTVTFQNVQWTGDEFRITPGCSRVGGTFQIRPREVCRLGQVTFRPNAPGARSGQIQLAGAPADTPTIEMLGNGIAPPGVPSLGQSTNYLFFPLGGVGIAGAPRAMTLTNFGTVPLQIRSISMTGMNAGDFVQTNNCGTTLGPGANCGVEVTFTPSATGNRVATLAVDDAANGRPHTVALWGQATDPEACFEQTHVCVDPRFFAKWQQRGLAINGYPLSNVLFERLEDGKLYQVQYFERVRMEYHREQSDPNYKVQLGQFGRQILAGVANAPTDHAAQKEGYPYFEQTGHNVRPEFMDYWEAHGGLDQFGYPLSEEFQQQLEDGNTYTVQYFERVRMEWHPEANDGQGGVLLGQFGRQVCGNRCR